VTKSQDATTPRTIQGRRAQLGEKTNHGGQEYYKIKLTDILVSGIQSTGGSTSSGGDRPTESLSLNFTKITFR
jgi:type VI protein secretion system component Hcp